MIAGVPSAPRSTLFPSRSVDPWTVGPDCLFERVGALVSGSRESSDPFSEPHPDAKDKPTTSKATLLRLIGHRPCRRTSALAFELLGARQPRPPRQLR